MTGSSNVDTALKAAAQLAEATGQRVLTEMPPPADEYGGAPALAGIYEMVCTSWDEPFIVLTPHPVTGVLVQTQHFKRHHEGDLVSLNGSQARRLLGCGAVVVPGSREQAKQTELERLIAASAEEIKLSRDRKRQVDASLTSVDLTPQQRALLEMDLERRQPGIGPSVAPGSEQ